MTRMRRRVSGFIVVIHIMSGSFSPRPLLRLMLAFAPLSESIISAFSRIYRDARRLFGRGPYKDHLWFSIKHGSILLEGPMFWFEIGAADYSYGMGFYSATPSQMEAFRRSLDSNPARFERIVRKIEHGGGFRLTGEEYKRPKGHADDPLGRWYNRKRIGLECSRDHDAALYSPELPGILTDAYAKLMPMYEYFLEFYHRADGEKGEKP